MVRTHKGSRSQQARYRKRRRTSEQLRVASLTSPSLSAKDCRTTTTGNRTEWGETTASVGLIDPVNRYQQQIKGNNLGVKLSVWLTVKYLNMFETRPIGHPSIALKHRPFGFYYFIFFLHEVAQPLVTRNDSCDPEPFVLPYYKNMELTSQSRYQLLAIVVGLPSSQSKKPPNLLLILFHSRF